MENDRAFQTDLFWSLKEALDNCQPDENQSGEQHWTKKNDKEEYVGKNRSFGEKTVRHFIQECTFTDMLGISEFTRHEGFRDREHLDDLITALIKDKRRELTLGDGRKAFKLFKWMWPASRVPLRDMSLFQLACTMKEAALVKKYLEQGVRVDRLIDTMYSGEFAGCSPLHLAIQNLVSLTDSHQRLQTTSLLLHHGANVHAKDSYGNTPLHTLLSGGPFDELLFETIMKYGADNHAVNNDGDTPFGLLIVSSKNLDIENYMKVGGSINQFNSYSHEGCMSDLVHRISAKKIGRASTLMEIDGHGRNSIHNLVSFSIPKVKGATCSEIYYNDMRTIIECVVRQGGDINCQDESGRTPLHYAASFQNGQSVFLLLRLGADINIINSAGKSALGSSLDKLTTSTEETNRNDSVIKILMMHLEKLKVSGLQVSGESLQNLDRATKKYEKDNVDEDDSGCEWEPLTDVN